MLPDSEDLEGPRLWIVIGLGNPGDEYAETYHNVGFRVVEILADRGGASNWSRPDSIGMIPARIAEIVVGQAGPNAILVQPWTYMNRTGEILAPLFDRFSPDARLLVVSDDLALPLGKIRLRQRGSAGGHNGLKSVGSAYGSDQYCRIRVGIDAGRPQGDTRDYVLSRVWKPERETLGRAEALAADAVEAVISESVPLAMSRFNGIDLREPEDGKT